MRVCEYVCGVCCAHMSDRITFLHWYSNAGLSIPLRSIIHLVHQTRNEAEIFIGTQSVSILTFISPQQLHTLSNPHTHTHYIYPKRFKVNAYTPDCDINIGCFVAATIDGKYFECPDKMELGDAGTVILKSSAPASVVIWNVI